MRLRENILSPNKSTGLCSIPTKISEKHGNVLKQTSILSNIYVLGKVYFQNP